MSAAGIHSWSGIGCATCAALALAAASIAAGPVFAQTNRQQREIRENSRDIQQQLQVQQRDQQMRFEMNQLRDQQLRQQQFQPLPPPSINLQAPNR